MKFLVTTFIFVNLILFGSIIEIDDIAKIDELIVHRNASSLVVFDVDDTLVQPCDLILRKGASRHFNTLTKEIKDRDIFLEIYEHAPLELVDQNVISLLDSLRKSKIPFVALTAAPAKLHANELPGRWRSDELSCLGIDFSASFPHLSEKVLKETRDQFLFPYHYKGIIFCAYSDKGSVMNAFLDYANYKPKHVIFIDDSLRNVEAVVAALENRGIAATGVHYTKTSQPDPNFNITTAKKQIDHFIENGEWLSDSEISAQ